MRKLAKNAKHRVAVRVRQGRHILRTSQTPDRYVFARVPYFSQWESRELNRQILTHEIRAGDDPKWRNSGATTKAEYASWSWSGCGMACLKMILACETGKTIPLVTLGKKCSEYGGYVMPLEKTNGLVYKPFAQFVEREFGLQTIVMPVMLCQDIIEALAHESYVIASVNAAIRDVNSKPKAKGGHLVLVVGYDRNKQIFYLHNPSGTSPKTQEYAEVSFRDFKKFFSGRGIIVNAAVQSRR